MRRGTLLVPVLAAAVLVGGGLAVTTLTGDETKSTSQARTDVPQTTERVKRENLVNTTSVSGTLGYARKRTLNGGASGTVTEVARNGTVLKRDDRLYAVDGTDVRLMYGQEPMYRTLKNGDTGTDVKQLKQNLIALGYGTGLAADEEFTGGTAKAVTRWQKDHGLKRTGRIGPEQVAFAPGPVRVASVQAAVGDRTAPGQPVLATTSSDRVVSLKVKVSETDLAKPGTKVRVELPNGTTTGGTVVSVGSTATTAEDGGDKTPTVGVTVTFDSPDAVDGIDKAPVTVQLTGQTRKGVLTVPVGALLALTDGSFGVQVVEGGGQAREVKVKLGMFAQGRVEITGPGLRAGIRVGVPSV